MPQTPRITILPGYPAHNARNYQGSLVGQMITPDARFGSDFESLYNPHGFGSPTASEHFRVTADNQCLAADGSGARLISFEDHRGTPYEGNATRFNVVSAGTGAAPAAKPTTTPGHDITRITRRFC